MWDKLEFYWYEMFDALKEYNENYGHCNVPHSWAEKPRLADWTFQQRLLYREGRLHDNKRKRLEQIGFVFDLHEIYWEEMFDTLEKYKEEHGNCNVPYEYRTKTNKALGRWVNRQRMNKSNRLRNDHIKRLDKIGFAWDEFGF